MPSKSSKGNEVFKHPIIGDFAHTTTNKAADAFEYLCKKSRLIADHPNFKTDLSRSRIDPECEAYRELIKKLPLWQETALCKLFICSFG